MKRKEQKQRQNKIINKNKKKTNKQEKDIQRRKQ